MAVSKRDIMEYRWMSRDEGFTALEHEVIFRDICSGCGNCEAVCPEDVVKLDDESPKLVGKCTECGYCLMQCPRSFFSPKDVENDLFGEYTDDELGHIEKKIGVKTKDKDLIDAVQDGGFVTTMLKYALENGIIDGAIVSGVNAKNKWLPEPVLVTKAKDLKKTAGTRYSNSPNLIALREAKKLGLTKLALVGLPCQIEAVRKIQQYPLEDVDLKDRIKYSIAIFCTSNFYYEGLMEDLAQVKYGVKLKDIKKVDIKGKNVLVFTEKEKIEIPLTEAYTKKRSGCKVCTDFSGRVSDISAGSVGAPNGYSSVFARTKDAEKLLDKMIKAGIFETVELKEEKPGLAIARFLQNKKDKENKEVIKEKIREAVPLPFKNMKF